MVEFRHRGAAGDLPNLAATASGPEPPSRRRERAPANAHLPNLTASTGQKARHRRLLRGGGAPSWAPPAAKGRRAAARGSGAPSWAPAPRDAPSWAPACAALGYPRSLRRVLPDAADREHLKRLYFENVRGRSPYLTDAPLHANAHHGVLASPQVRGRSPHLTYYNLLVHLARGTTERRDERVWGILEAIERRIADEFGPGFVLANDFFSFRAPSVRMFQNWHQARRPEHS